MSGDTVWAGKQSAHLLLSERQRRKVQDSLNELATTVKNIGLLVPHDLWARYNEALKIIAAPATTAPLHD